MSTIWYCTREDVKNALDSKETARNNAQIDRLIAAASESIEGMTHRKFYPQLATRYFDWPDFQQFGTSYRLWIDDEAEIISVTSLLSGTTAITADKYFLEPINDGPPYDHLELNVSLSASFGQGTTRQRDVAITGLFGYRDDSETVGTLDGSINSSVTTLNLNNGASVGVGTLIRIGDERLVVTAKRMVDSTDTLQNDIGSNLNVALIPVSNSANFNYDEVIMIDAERMIIVDIAGNNLIVKRAWDGSALAAHTSTTKVYVAREMGVTRAQAGTIAASHTDGDTVTKWVPPSLISQLARAETLNSFLQESSGYGRTVGQGDNQQEARGAGLDKLRKQVFEKYGRIRMGVV